MNEKITGTGDGGVQPSNQRVIQIVVIAIAANATMATAALGYCLVNKITPEAVLLTAFVGLVGTLFGYLGGMLSRTTPSTAPTTQYIPDAVAGDKPAQPVIVTNDPNKPAESIPVTETAKPTEGD